MEDKSMEEKKMENEMTEDKPIEDSKLESQTIEPIRKSRTWMYIGGALIVVLLAGAALVGGRLLGQKPTPPGTEFAVEMQRAEELPEQDPELTGMVTEIGEGGGIFAQEFAINTSLGMPGGSGGVMVQGDAAPIEGTPGGGEFNVVIAGDNGSMEGPVLEVVVSADTKVYQDVTGPMMVMSSGEGQPAEVSGDNVQKINEASASDISKGCIITVWGERRGDRIIADFILFMSPLGPLESPK